MVVQFELHSVRKQRTTIRTGTLEEHRIDPLYQDPFTTDGYLPSGLYQAPSLMFISSGPPYRVMDKVEYPLFADEEMEALGDKLALQNHTEN